MIINDFLKSIFTILLECCHKVVKTVDRLKFCPHDMKSAVAQLIYTRT